MMFVKILVTACKLGDIVLFLVVCEGSSVLLQSIVMSYVDCDDVG